MVYSNCVPAAKGAQHRLPTMATKVSSREAHSSAKHLRSWCHGPHTLKTRKPLLLVASAPSSVLVPSSACNGSNLIGMASKNGLDKRGKPKTQSETS